MVHRIGEKRLSAHKVVVETHEGKELICKTYANYKRIILNGTDRSRM